MFTVKLDLVLFLLLFLSAMVSCNESNLYIHGSAENSVIIGHQRHSNPHKRILDSVLPGVSVKMEGVNVEKYHTTLSSVLME